MAELFANDRNWVAAGAAAAILLPVLVFGFGLPFPVATAVAALAFAGLVFLLQPRRLFEGIDVSKVGRARLDVARKVLTEAEPAVERLAATAARVRSPTIKGRVERLAATARAIVAGVEADPSRLASVQRFLTYYLPRAGDLAESYAVLEHQRSPDPARVSQVEELIGKLDEAFTHYADSLLESDLSGLDVELRLLQSSLEEDMGRRS